MITKTGGIALLALALSGCTALGTAESTGLASAKKGVSYYCDHIVRPGGPTLAIKRDAWRAEVKRDTGHEIRVTCGSQ